MTTTATQKLPYGVSHNVGGRRYEKIMPLSLFQALPEKIQGKIKAALKREETAVKEKEAANADQKTKTETEQAEVEDKKAADKKPVK